MELLQKEVEAIRKEHPGCGVEKMYYALTPRWVGRDKFCEIFMGLGYGVKQIRNYQKTTVPSHINYPNLIEGMVVTRPYQLIQSDITYFYLNDRFYYMVFIIDVYTREILGHKVSDNMRAEANHYVLKKSLTKMDFKNGGLIHHSDRGSQYGSSIYTNELKKHGIAISMGLIAQDNAFVERVNGTIKNEYLKRWHIRTGTELIYKTRKAVHHYNLKRPHLAFNNKHSPLSFKNTLVDLNTQKRPKVIIFAEGKHKHKLASSQLVFNPEQEPMAHNCPIDIN